jgi:glucokinase
MGKIVSIDVGSTNLRIGLVERAGKSLRMIYKKPVDCREFMEQIYDVVDGVGKFDGIGISMPGILDMNKGILCYAPNLNLRNLNVVELLQNRYHVDVSLSNDETAAVMGEKLFGAGKKFENIVHISFGTGIGCGVIVNDRLLLGKDGNAHEVGCCTIDVFATLRCSCGAIGHWEAYCSGYGIPNFTRKLLDTVYKNDKSELRDIKDLTASQVYKTARHDAVADKIVKEIGRLNAMGVANAINCYDPELVTIGGGIALGQPDAVMEPILKHVKEHTINRMPKIMITPLGEKAGLYGAVVDFLDA